MTSEPKGNSYTKAQDLDRIRVYTSNNINYGTFETQDQGVITDYGALYWGELSRSKSAEEKLRKTISTLKENNVALKKALEGFIGRTI